jgi:hypothetical protein
MLHLALSVSRAAVCSQDMVHVKAHTGGADWQSRWNDAADAMAKAAATLAEQPLPLTSRPFSAAKFSTSTRTPVQTVAAASAASAAAVYTDTADYVSYSPSIVPALLPPPSHSLLPPPRIVDALPRKRAPAPAPVPASTRIFAAAVAGDAIGSFGSDDDLGAAIEEISGGSAGRGRKGGRGGGAGKKPFYNKAYASKYHWRGKSKRAEVGAESAFAGRGGRSRSFSSVSGGGRGAAAAAVGVRQRRMPGEEWVELPMYSNYGTRSNCMND